MSSLDPSPFENFSQVQVRPASACYQAEVIRLIDGCYADHGDQVILSGDDRDLLDLDTHYRQAGGEFILLLDRNDRVVGCHAVLPLIDKPHCCTFKRLYLHASLRGSGLGFALMQWAVNWAKNQRYKRIEFWSDTRFQRAHQFFRNQGFETEKTIRHLNDGIQPYSEFFFWMDL